MIDRRRRILSWMCCGSLLFLGCGLAEYEARLTRTGEFHSYLNTVDQSLAPAWQRADRGLAMRVPLPFRQPLPGPEVLKDDQGHEFFGPDARQPGFLSLTLPGIVDAWQAEFPAENGESAPALFFILSNHDRFATFQDGGPAPGDFLTDVEIAVASAFGVTIPEGKVTQPADNQRFREFHPPQRHPFAQFTVPKDYMTIRIVPNRPIGDHNYQAMLYERNAGEIQAAVLVITPGGTTAQFRQRLDLSLQTFHVAGQAPRPGQRSGTSSGGPGGGGTSNF